MKKWWIAGVAAAIIAVVAASVFLYQRATAPATVRIGEREFAMRIARSPAELEQGLSGTQEMPAGEALVFDFGRTDQWGIWMKDMNYSIDILWLDAAKKVIHIERGASPDSYPDTTYRAPNPSRYVIELKAGAAEASRITIGTQAVFDSTKGSFE